MRSAGKHTRPLPPSNMRSVGSTYSMDRACSNQGAASVFGVSQRGEEWNGARGLKKKTQWCSLIVNTVEFDIIPSKTTQAKCYTALKRWDYQLSNTNNNGKHEKWIFFSVGVSPVTIERVLLEFTKTQVGHLLMEPVICSILCAGCLRLDIFLHSCKRATTWVARFMWWISHPHDWWLHPLPECEY